MTPACSQAVLAKPDERAGLVYQSMGRELAEPKVLK
jgi:hypothetical protein